MKLPITSPYFDENEIENLKSCLESKWVTQGPSTSKFENLFKEQHQVPFAIATTSCTAALHLSAMALDLGAGDEVIVPAFTWVTSAHCAEYVGAKPVFAEVKPETFNLDPQAFESAITSNTRAVVVVHLFGLSAQMDEILTLARKHSLYIIEDAACAVGTTYKDQPVGGFGDLGCFSFHPRKIITTGEGGMITTSNEALAKKIFALRNHGHTGYPEAKTVHPYTMGNFDTLGFNLRLSDIQAAVGLAQMDKLDFLLQHRLECARRYNQKLSDIDDIAIPFVPEKCGHTYQSYVIKVVKGGMAARNHIMEYLNNNGIQTRPGTHAVHRLGYYRNKYGLKPGDFPISAACEDTSITLPIIPGMNAEQQTYVVKKIIAALTKSR